MHRNNERSVPLFGLLILLVWAIVVPTLAFSQQNPAPTAQVPQTQTQQTQPQAPAQGQASPQAPAQGQADDGLILPPEDGQPAPPSNPANQPGNSVQVSPNQGSSSQVQQENGGFVIRTQVREVTLHATVVDDKSRLVTGLDRSAFTVFEDGQPQKITSFRREDIPVALGIVIDNSGSMRDKRPGVNQAALNLVRASNPQDEVFVVNFNQDYYLDQDYTGNTTLLKDALERIESRGGTALYDAVVASADHLMKSARLQKRVILVVTDGEDNASMLTLEQAVRKIAVDGGPTVYTIGILGGEKEKRARRALRILAEQTGGVSFFPRDISEVDSITRQVAHDIRNQYTIGYKPTTPQNRGGYRTVRVDARANGYKRLQVRTRSGYYAGDQASTAAAK